MKEITVKENNNFVSVEDYGWLDINKIINTIHTKHLDDERKNRIEKAIELNKLSDGNQAEIIKVFLVDKNHKDGKELHCVTGKGIIFILNENKYIENNPCLITILFPRPNQIIRLYEEIGEEPPKKLINFCVKNIRHKLHR